MIMKMNKKLKGEMKMETMQMTVYAIEEKKSGFVFSSAKTVEYLKEGRTEYSINGVEVSEDDFDEWLDAYYRMPDEATSIDVWQA